MSTPNRGSNKSRSKSSTVTPARIYLVGFMGCGKSTIGPILANVFGYSFVDLDAEIVAYAGKSVPSLFREYGEEGFRAMETTCLSRISAADSTVISLGGGVLTHPENARHVLETGLVIFLKMDLKTAVARLRKNRGRPMLWGADERPLEGEDLDQRVSHLMRWREDDYEQAHLTIPTTNRPVGSTVDRVVTAIRSWTSFH